jgi:hypothetical protein
MLTDECSAAKPWRIWNTPLDFNDTNGRILDHGKKGSVLFD